MAMVTFSGIDGELAKLQRISQSTDEALKKAVKAGGDLLAEKLREAAPVRTGGLQKSIKAGKVEYSAGDGYTTEVKPTGNDPRGESYARIGNVLEYGRGKTLTARPWFNPTVLQAESAVKAKMAEVFKSETEKEAKG